MEHIKLNTKSNAISTPEYFFNLLQEMFKYVGKTAGTFCQFMPPNLSMIRSKKQNTLAEHIYSDERTVHDISVVGLENIYGDVTYWREGKGILLDENNK